MCTSRFNKVPRRDLNLRKKNAQWPIANIQSLVNFELYSNFVSVFSTDSGVARTNLRCSSLQKYLTSLSR